MSRKNGKQGENYCSLHVMAQKMKRIKVNVKQSRYMPGVAQRVPGI